jgi:hypothetical protein
MDLKKKSSHTKEDPQGKIVQTHRDSATTRREGHRHLNEDVGVEHASRHLGPWASVTRKLLRSPVAETDEMKSAADRLVLLCVLRRVSPAWRASVVWCVFSRVFLFVFLLR